MGLFDRKKKDIPEETKAEANESYEIQEKKDFTLMVEIFRIDEMGHGSVVGGTVRGTVKVGQTVFVIPPSGLIYRSDVARIEIGPGNEVQSATDTRVVLFLTGVNKVDQVPKFTVISSKRPQKEGEQEAYDLPSNPQFIGLSMEFPKYSADNQYMSVFAYILCHSKFITPVNKTDVTTSDANGSVKFYTINNSVEPEKQYLPLFTNFEIMADWKNFVEDEAKSLKMNFQDVARVTETMDGAVINPFGPMPVPVPKEFIESITSMEGYKKEFEK